MPEIIFIYVACPDMDVASRIGRDLVESRHAASVNIIPNMHSIYRWGGEIVDGDETVMIIKTTSIQFDEIRMRIRAMHPYQMPCIAAFPITQGDPPYLDWVAIGSTPTVIA
jgi:periplasmic divalent cation tolerance protein